MIHRLLKLDEVVETCRVNRPVAAAPDPDAPSGDMGRPYWVVVVNPRRQPPQPKFHTGHLTAESAERMRVDRQAAADAQADAVTAERGQPWPAFRYFIVERPPGGVL